MGPAFDFAELRKTEFGRLDATGSVYMDYTGAALYPESLVCRSARRLNGCVFGNPHSESGPSLASTEAMNEARRLTLRFLHADESKYDVVFTANASGGMRLLAEAFPFGRESRLVLTADNHNSVNGLRVRARRRRAAVQYVPLTKELRAADVREFLPAVRRPSLLAYPAQSNFSGVQHPLGWIGLAQRHGYRVLLDAAAFVPANPLSLAEFPADFVALSFYKMFGYPTGVGALVAKREALVELRRSYFAGGTVQFASVQNELVRRRDGGEGFEDGTPNFLAMPAVCDGLRWMEGLGVRRVHARVAAVTESLLDGLNGLGDSVCVYGPREMRARGGTVSFNVCRAGRVVPFEVVEAAARERGIAVRGGCFCNPGAAEFAFEIPAGRARRCLRGEFSTGRFRECLQDRAVGAVRASVGVASTEGDVERLVAAIGAVAG
ncbi:MAG TPA: aminotransferase class V-fold PLP-dependent enzyme [Candidatus Limnocylindrales bacterium]|nr:aminotransferase class V-fold PLP-dependent enzyme [Candidatus Limnocylindrales bacterium]